MQLAYNHYESIVRELRDIYFIYCDSLHLELQRFREENGCECRKDWRNPEDLPDCDCNWSCPPAIAYAFGKIDIRIWRVKPDGGVKQYKKNVLSLRRDLEKVYVDGESLTLAVAPLETDLEEDNPRLDPQASPEADEQVPSTRATHRVVPSTRPQVVPPGLRRRGICSRASSASRRPTRSTSASSTRASAASRASCSTCPCATVARVATGSPSTRARARSPSGRGG